MFELVDPIADVFENLGQVEVPLGGSPGHHVLDLGVALRVERSEAQILELLLELLHPEAVSQGRVDVQRLARRPLLLPVRQCRDGPQIVQPIAELDDQDPDVLGHRHDHLPERRSLGGLPGIEANPVELGHAVDDGGDVGAERSLDVVELDPRVLDGVVEERRCDRDLVETEVGDDLGHRQRVHDVGLTRLAELGGVGFGRHFVGARHHVDLAFPVGAAKPLDQPGDLVFGLPPFPAPREDPFNGDHPRVTRGRSCWPSPQR